MSSLGDSQVLAATLVVPEVGSCRADVVIDSGSLPTGKTTLKIGDLSMSVSVLRSDFDAASRAHAVVVGGIGWQNLVASPVSFQSSAGVRLATVLGEIARRAGETIAQPTDREIGKHFECGASRAGEPVRWVDVLNDLTRSGYVQTWRVDADGVTRFAPRASSTNANRATLLRRDASIGLSTYGIDTPSGMLPGNVVEDVTITKLVVRDAHGKLEADVYSKTKSPPAIRELVRRLLPDSPEWRASTYVVVTANSDGTLDLVPPPDAKHLPELKNVEQWEGGVRYVPNAGTQVVVLYRDDRRTRPIAIAFAPDVNPFAGVARLGDTVTFLMPPATFTGTINGLPASGAVVWPSQSTGTITTSSARTKAGP